MRPDNAHPPLSLEDLIREGAARVVAASKAVPYDHALFQDAKAGWEGLKRLRHPGAEPVPQHQMGDSVSSPVPRFHREVGTYYPLAEVHRCPWCKTLVVNLRLPALGIRSMLAKERTVAHVCPNPAGVRPLAVASEPSPKVVPTALAQGLGSLPISAPIGVPHFQDEITLPHREALTTRHIEEDEGPLYWTGNPSLRSYPDRDASPE